MQLVLLQLKLPGEVRESLRCSVLCPGFTKCRAVAEIQIASGTDLSPADSALAPLDTFPRRHIGPGPAEQQAMLRELGFTSMEQLISQTVPESIRLQRDLEIPAARSESQLLERTPLKPA